MVDDEAIMRRCIELAERGRGGVSPNPMVGCVIVKGGKVIGEGYHKKFGGPHAEVNAVRSASSSVAGADVYVSLEPCSHHGKTPPCVDLLIEKKVRRVFVSMLDPNPAVNGRGVSRLRRAGIEVRVGLLSKQSAGLNESFTKFIRSGVPFVTLKAAQSLDGRIALANGRSKYITSNESLKMVHETRAAVDAVLVGAGTVMADDPSLTVRLSKGRSPVRLILDGRLRVPLGSKMFHDGASRVVVFHASGFGSERKLSSLRKLGVDVVALRGRRNGRIPVAVLLKTIGELGISHLLVEGGSTVFSDFLESRAVDKLMIFTAPVILGKGVGLADGIEIKDLGRALRLKNVTLRSIGVDQLLTARF